MTQYCHKAVRELAKELAGAAYEDFAKNDEFYKTFPNQNLYIAKRWKNFVAVARSTMVYMLGKSHYPEAMRADLYDIIVKDRELQHVQSVPAADFASSRTQGSA